MRKLVCTALLAATLLGLSACTNHEVQKDFDIITPQDSTLGVPYVEEVDPLQK